jgi:hypothetical protein
MGAVRMFLPLLLAGEGGRGDEVQKAHLTVSCLFLRNLKIAAPACCIVIMFSSASAQSELEFSGYVVDFPVYQRTTQTIAQLFGTEQDQFLNITRVRLRPTAHLWSGAFLVLEYEASALYQSTSQLITESPDRRRRQLVDLTWNPVSERHFTLLHFVDRLFLRQTSNLGDFTLGRQRISWGTGRVWNPTDLFNPINPTTFSKIEKDGVDAFSAKFHLGSFTDLHLVVNPENAWKTVNSGARFRTNVSEFDFSVMVGGFDKRLVVGGDVAGNLFDAGVRGEIIAVPGRNSSDTGHVKFILGADYQFTAEFYGMIEYHYNGEGRTTKERYELLRLLRGDILNVARDYLAATGSYMIHPLVNSSVSLTFNLNDGSRFVSGVVTYLAGEEISISLGAQLFGGNEFTEYWYYPHSVFLKADVFF